MRIREQAIVALMGVAGIKTKTALAQRCGWSPQLLDRYLHNRRRSFSTTTVDKLCRALDAQPGDFLEYVAE